ncbi:MAG: hypothetical protein ACHQRM_16380 [Bacteroidia bacterium]
MKRIAAFLLIPFLAQASRQPDLASRLPAFGQPETLIQAPAQTYSPGFNQDNLMYKTRTNTYYPSILLRVGMIDFDMQHFNEHVSAFINTKFMDIIPYAGLSYEFPIKLRKGGSFDNYIELNAFYPQKLMQGKVLEANLNGFSGTIACGRDVAPTNTHFDMVFAIGLTGGMVHYGEINYNVNYAGYAYSQYYFGPMFMVQPKWIIGQMVIGLRGSYRLDLLNQNWAGDTGADLIPPVVANGWTAELIIGVQLGAYY